MYLRRIVLITCLSAAVLTGTAHAAEPAGRGAIVRFGVFGPYAEGRVATTYDTDLVPNGSRAAVASFSRAEVGTTVLLLAWRLEPNRHYGAHVHTQPCGAAPTAAGPHYQNVPDPVQPSTDPKYANPYNEIWLDFHTDARGNGSAVANVGWTFDERPAGSVVIHEHETATDPGKAGTAGARVACISVPFSTVSG